MNYRDLGKLLLDYNKGIKGRTYYDRLVTELLEHYTNHTVGTSQEITTYDLHYTNKEMFETMVSTIKDAVLMERLRVLKPQVRELINNGISKEDIINHLFD